jgi:hypothetical protein
MNTKSSLIGIAVAAALLGGMPSAHALTPWTDGTPELTVYVSGGAAQDLAFAEVVKNNLAETSPTNTLDTFGDATTTTSSNFGARWTVYYFTGKTGTAWAGRRIALVKRSLGAAGYGVVPVVANPQVKLEELTIDTLTAPGTANSPVTAEGTNRYRVVVTGGANGNAGTLLTLIESDAGITGVDPKLLLKPGSINYPGTVARVGTGSDTFPTNINGVPDGFTQVNTGGQVYGIAVTTDLYKVLQAAQKISGTINPAAIGDYTNENDIPTLSRNFVASLLAGKIQTWDQVQVVAKTTAGGATVGTAYSLTSPTVTGLANVQLPTLTASQDFPNQTPVAVSVRNSGAAIGAVAYSVFLNHPFTSGSYAIPPATDAAFDTTAAPIIKRPGGTTATGNLLDDWNQGTNTSNGLNSTSSKFWGIAVNTADPNGSGSVGTNPEDVSGKKHFRYVRIDGAAPTIENVANGSYPHWAEGVLIYKNTLEQAQDGTVKVALLTALANGLASPTTAKTVNDTLVHTWGRPGIFGLTANGETQTIPFSDNTPVVAYSHNSSGVVAQGEIVPTISGAAGGVLLK